MNRGVSKATVLEALQAGVSNNTALIKEAENYLKTVEGSPAFHLTLIVSCVCCCLYFYINMLCLSTGNLY